MATTDREKGKNSGNIQFSLVIKLIQYGRVFENNSIFYVLFLDTKTNSIISTGYILTQRFFGFKIILKDRFIFYLIILVKISPFPVIFPTFL